MKKKQTISTGSLLLFAVIHGIGVLVSLHLLNDMYNAHAVYAGIIIAGIFLFLNLLLCCMYVWEMFRRLIFD